MKSNQSKIWHDKLQDVYFEYLTDYLIFSEEYNTLIENKMLDSSIESGYVYYLYSNIKEIQENNIYPSRIIDNFIVFLSLLEKRTKEILKEEELHSMEPLFIEMYENLSNVRDMDDYEIYHLEYVKRYSNMKDLNKIKGISVKQLEKDIQLDYLYLSLIMFNREETIEYIGSDFAFFLQKLMIDFPELIYFPAIRGNIREIIIKKNDPNLNEYLSFIERPYIYKNNIGFNIDTCELLYCNTLLQKMIFTKNTKDILNNIDPKVIFTTAFFNNLCNELALYIRKGEITIQEKEAYQEIIYFMREHMNVCLPMYKSHYTALINNWIHFFNTSIVTTDVSSMYKSSLRKSQDLTKLDRYLYSKDENSYQLKANVQMELAHDIMECFFGKDNIEELKEDGIYTISALTYLFNEYPKMFFEPTIYQKAMELIDSIHCSKGKSLKKRIKRMRKK